MAEHAELHRKLWKKHGQRKDYVAWKSLLKQIASDEARRLTTSLANKGRVCFWKGKKRPEHSKKMKGIRTWNTGLVDCWTDEQLKNFKEKSSGKNNAMFGLKGKLHPSHGHIGGDSPRVTCPHCGKVLDKGNAKQWHFDKCKLYRGS